MTLKIPAKGTPISEAATMLAGILNAFRARGFDVAVERPETLVIMDRFDLTFSYITIKTDHEEIWRISKVAKDLK